MVQFDFNSCWDFGWRRKDRHSVIDFLNHFTVAHLIFATPKDNYFFHFTAHVQNIKIIISDKFPFASRHYISGYLGRKRKRVFESKMISFCLNYFIYALAGVLILVVIIKSFRPFYPPIFIWRLSIQVTFRGQIRVTFRRQIRVTFREQYPSGLKGWLVKLVTW